MNIPYTVEVKTEFIARTLDGKYSGHGADELEAYKNLEAAIKPSSSTGYQPILSVSHT